MSRKNKGNSHYEESYVTMSDNIYYRTIWNRLKMEHKTPIPAAILDNLEHFKDQALASHPNYNKLSFVQQDFDYAKQFLLNYLGSLATYNTYRREIERYLQWAWLIQKQSIATIRRKDIENYLALSIVRC